jgi:RNA polymerase sigma-70 factor (ECF subfamily)
MFCRNNSDKEDLYQEITLQLWKSFSSFKGQAAFSTWMYRVALNTAITMTKKPDLFVDTNKVSAVPYEMDNTTEFSEDVKILYKAITLLNRVEKGIILLWLEEKSYEEIFETIGISVKNVSVKLVRIKSKLGQIIKKIQ